ncbi:MAG: orotidine-5'-phosphate decarboxylase [Rhodospirillales bacterium]|nr:orotidine-5'-phosphate decarboxylase [Rhodospirillales bacterium]MCB9996092.1 orotidine-5'-phosphate decarboxylase [Rhodospirillales bacterium]
MAETLPPIFCAIDTNDLDHAKALAAAMQKAGCGIKLGLEFFNAFGPRGVQEIKDSYEELPLFLDLKYHDIPNTVAGALRAIARLAPAYLNVHASGGKAMMQAGLEALREESDKIGVPTPKLLAVTMLTSLDEDTLAQTGFQPGMPDRVQQLARLTQESGLDGVVCSAREIEELRGLCGPEFALMVPGIRPAGTDAGDQKRVMTPEEALQKGATHLVIGRPITGTADPAAAAAGILQSLEKQAA